VAIRDHLEFVLANYAAARSGPFHAKTPVWIELEELREELQQLPLVQLPTPRLEILFSAGSGAWATIPWLGFFDPRETKTPQRGVFVVFRFRADGSGVYLTLAEGFGEGGGRAGSAKRRQSMAARKPLLRGLLPELAERFRLDDEVDLRSDNAKAKAYEQSAIAHKLYERGALPSDAEIEDDLRLMLTAYERYVTTARRTARPRPDDSSFDRVAAMRELLASIDGTGFHYEPWQVAAFVTAVRTKPFVILAGTTGTGKSRLPALVAEATGAACRITPVRADWTDSGDVIGFSNLQGAFQPGSILRAAREAAGDAAREHFYVLDEMNIARVEHYAPELLSVMESRTLAEGGEYRTRPLFSQPLAEEAAEWQAVDLPPNFAVVGTVNMDETTSAFSRKVLDRAFTIELARVDLTRWRRTAVARLRQTAWPDSAWRPRAIRLGELEASASEEAEIDGLVAVLEDVNRCLQPAQLQFAYRTRDEIALFVLHAGELREFFGDVDPLDLALLMKVLPRIAGGSMPVRQAVIQLLGLCVSGERFREEREAESAVQGWVAAERPLSFPGARFGQTAARLALMFERFTYEAQTSFWL
jgi:MoxR-like ATPase